VTETQQRAKVAGRRLIEAVRALACKHPIYDISVAALCQQAGLTRDTFYRYASRPIDVLARAMDEDLPAPEELLSLLQRSKAASSLEAPGRIVLEHVARNRAIYRRALHPHLDSALREVLIGRIEALLTGFLQVNPESVPAIGGAHPTTSEARRLAVFTAAGIVGAIEDWLAQDQPESLDRMLELLFTAAAPWWRPGLAAGSPAAGSPVAGSPAAGSPVAG
jgi:AcrR family transcriptional regulator